MAGRIAPLILAQIEQYLTRPHQCYVVWTLQWHVYLLSRDQEEVEMHLSRRINIASCGASGTGCDNHLTQ